MLQCIGGRRRREKRERKGASVIEEGEGKGVRQGGNGTEEGEEGQ